MKTLTRAEMRDRIRRRLGIIPPISLHLPGAAAGQAPTAQPWPDNDTLNDAIEEAIAEVNRETGFSRTSTPHTLVIDGSSATGPAHRFLFDPIPGDIENAVNIVRSVQWLKDGDDNTQYRRLLPTTFEQMAYDGVDYQNMAAATPPLYYVVEGYTLYLVPAPADDGIVLFTAEITSRSPENDGQGVLQMPADWLPCVINLAAGAFSEDEDTGLARRAAGRKAEGERTLAKMVEWSAEKDAPSTACLYYAGDYRRGSYRR